MLSLEHLKLLQSIVTNFLKLSFILSVNFCLDVLPVVLGEFLLFIFELEGLLDWDRVRSLINRLFDLHWHLGDSRAHINILHGFPHDLGCLLDEFWFNWVDVLKILLFLSLVVLLLLHGWWARLNDLDCLLRVLWCLNVLHWLLNILDCMLFKELWLLLVVSCLLDKNLLLSENWLLGNDGLWWCRMHCLHNHLLWSCHLVDRRNSWCSALHNWHRLLHSLHWWLVSSSHCLLLYHLSLW